MIVLRAFHCVGRKPVDETGDDEAPCGACAPDGQDYAVNWAAGSLLKLRSSVICTFWKSQSGSEWRIAASWVRISVLGSRKPFMMRLKEASWMPSMRARRFWRMPEVYIFSLRLG